MTIYWLAHTRCARSHLRQRLSPRKLAESCWHSLTSSTTWNEWPAMTSACVRLDAILAKAGVDPEVDGPVYGIFEEPPP